MKNNFVVYACFAVLLLAARVVGAGEGGLLMVGVLEGWSSDSLLATLEEEDGIKGTEIPRFTAEALEDCDVLILTQQRSPALLRRRVGELINWVNEGGGVLLLHDAVGYRAHMAMFPLIGTGYYHPKLDRVRIAKEHPLTEDIPVGKVFSPGFRFDHVVIEPGPGGTTVVDNEEDQSVVVVGEMGMGRVVLNGMLTGHWSTRESGTTEERKEYPVGEERKILVNSLYWLANRER